VSTEALKGNSKRRRPVTGSRNVRSHAQLGLLSTCHVCVTEVELSWALLLCQHYFY